MSIENIADEAFEIAPDTDIPEATPYDKTLAAFVPIPLDNRERLERADKQLIKVHRDINESDTVIDQLGFYTYRTGTHQMFVFNPTTPIADVDSDWQTELTQDSTGKFLPDRLAVVIDALNEHLPTWITPKIGPWWLGAFGLSPVVVCRLVMPDDGKITRDQNLNTNVLEDLIKTYSDESYLYQAIIRHRPGDLPPHYEYSVTVRIALFATRHQVNTRAELAEVLGGNRPRNPTKTYAPLGVSSNWDEFDGPLYQWGYDPEFVQVRNSSSIENLDDVFEYATGKAEWKELLRERYVGAGAYDHVCDYTEMMVRETDLKQFVTLAAPSESESAWSETYGRNPSRATELNEPSRSGKQTVLELADENADPPEDIATKERSSANDGNDEHWEDIKTAARIFREQGYEVSIIEQDTESRPDLWIRDQDDTIYAVEVECTSPSNPDNALTNITRGALWGYPVIIVATDESVADTISDLIAKPFRETDGHRTRFYNADQTVITDGNPLVVQKDADETAWWATPDQTRQLIIDGKVIAEAPLDAPFDEPDYPLPRLHKEDGQYIVKDPDGSVRARYQGWERFKSNWRQLSAAHIPVDLSYFRFVGSIHVLNDTQLSEYQPTANWETPMNAQRHEASHEDAFSTFLIDNEGSELDEPPVRKFIRNWIGAQTQYAPPADNIYGEYRQDYTDRSRNDERNGANKFYKDKAYRFPRGLVHPDLKGLDTVPQLPDEWDIAEDQRLQDPIIPDLDTQTTTYDQDTE